MLDHADLGLLKPRPSAVQLVTIQDQSTPRSVCPRIQELLGVVGIRGTGDFLLILEDGVRSTHGEGILVAKAASLANG